jgi:hypothetical protein
VPFRAKGARATEVPVDVEAKRALLEAHASQRYSTEGLLAALAAGRADALVETWHLLQSRDAGDDDPIAKGAAP